ncbi:Rae1-like protein [Morus notabilis]|uniref:Rae1-like protein n=1 Tax=Morus notabilis TaxID=981085 RepID=W9R3T8_9ROSA|nr:Rae1-like protein [Morus notabilis]
MSSTAKVSISHDRPVLCSTWKEDGTTVFSSGCDNQVKMWPLLSGAQPTTVATHDAPIKDLAWIPEMNLLLTGSWDKTLKYWDTRQANPVHTQQLPDRCYAMSVRHPVIVVGTADRNLIVFYLKNPQTEFKRITSPLKFQTRRVAVFPDKLGFLVGSLEGRVAVHHINDLLESKNFTFKCHRDEANKIYSVNSINFHPVYKTFATAGSDGAFNFWSKENKTKLKGKDEYLTGAAAMPKATDPGFRKWRIENSMIMSWLINSMNNDIGENFLLFGTAKEIWDAAKETYSSSENTLELFQVESTLHDFRQGEQSVTQYYNTLTRYWQQLDLFETHSWKCPEDAATYK